jgi:hypothetical protein
MKKTLPRKLLCIGIAIVTLSWGIATVASVRLTVGAIASFASNLKAKKNSEPMPVPEVAATAPVEPVITTYDDVIDEKNDSSDEFNPTGEYYLDSETVPKAFSDISHLDLQTREYYEENGTYIDRPIVPLGSLRGKKAAKLTRIAIGGREIAFQTDTADGISYRFVGRFTTAEYCETGGDTPDLKGKLIKIKDGKWSAEMEAEFYLQCGC